MLIAQNYAKLEFPQDEQKASRMTTSSKQDKQKNDFSKTGFGKLKSKKFVVFPLLQK
jgi:hypothetical protein